METGYQCGFRTSDDSIIRGSVINQPFKPGFLVPQFGIFIDRRLLECFNAHMKPQKYELEDASAIVVREILNEPCVGAVA